MSVELMNICMKILDLSHTHAFVYTETDLQYEDMRRIYRHLLHAYKIALIQNANTYTSYTYDLLCDGKYVIRKGENLRDVILRIIKWIDIKKVKQMNSSQRDELFLLVYSAVCVIIHEFTLGELLLCRQST